MYSKIIFNEFSDIITDELFNKLENDEIKQEDIIKNEIENLKKQGIIFLNEELLVIKTPTFKVKYLELPFELEECNEKGFLKSRQKENLLENSNNIKNAKCKLIIEYFKNHDFKNAKSLYGGNIVSFQPPYGKQHNDNHNTINTFNFNIKSYSEFDMTDPIWIKESEKITKILIKLWKESIDKKNLVYNYNSEYLDPIIKTKFPEIIKQKKTNLLFKYDENKKCYVEMIETKNQSELTNLIQINMFNDNNNLINLKQIAEVKEYIINTYNFEIKDFEKCHLYNCNNGVLNLITGELSEHSSKYFFNYCSSINYDKNVDNTRLYGFIKSVVTENNPIELISKILGHIHYQGTKLQKGFLFVGTKQGRNGKGTLVKLMNEVIGDQRSVTLSLNMFQDSTFSEYDLKDKALYIEDDYKEDYISQKTVGLLNRMITGVETQVHQKNKPAIKIKYTSIPLIQCNKIPKLKCDDDGGFYLRWVQVHFDNEFGHKMNEFLGDQLLNDSNVMSSMLNLLITGYNLILDRKKENTTKSFFKDDENNNDWKKSNNQILEFIDDCCEIGSNYKVSSRDLYLYYKNDWNLGGIKLSETKFIKMIKEELNLETKRITVSNGKKQTVIFGLTCDEILNLENVKTEI